MLTIDVSTIRDYASHARFASNTAEKQKRNRKQIVLPNQMHRRSVPFGQRHSTSGAYDRYRKACCERIYRTIYSTAVSLSSVPLLPPLFLHSRVEFSIPIVSAVSNCFAIAAASTDV